MLKKILPNIFGGMLKTVADVIYPHFMHAFLMPLKRKT
jgi:hypothetical protein